MILTTIKKISLITLRRLHSLTILRLKRKLTNPLMHQESRLNTKKNRLTVEKQKIAINRQNLNRILMPNTKQTL